MTDLEQLYETEDEVVVQIVFAEDLVTPHDEVEGPSSNRDKHLNLKPFHCHKCILAFETKHKLKKHIEREHWDKTPCSICGKDFSTFTALKCHRIEVHSVENEGPFFECTICSRRFACNGRYERHRRRKIHSFSVENVLMSELPIFSPVNRIHKEERSCYFCGMTLGNRHTLERHLRTHTRERPFICPNYSKCGKDFADQGYFTKHIKLCNSNFIKD